MIQTMWVVNELKSLNKDLEIEVGKLDYYFGVSFRDSFLGYFDKMSVSLFLEHI